MPYSTFLASRQLLQTFIEPASVLSMFVLSFILVWSFWVEANLCRLFLILFICIAVDPIINMGGLGSQYLV
jgi:CHASE2 domain-containing sensor protein